jgi:hypothetical protein
MDDAVRVGEEEARPAPPPLRASDVAALLARLDTAAQALFTGPPVAAAMSQVARLLVALAEFSFDLYRRLNHPEKAQQRDRALRLLDTLFERAFSTAGIGAGAADGWLVRAWLSPQVRPSLREAWESNTLGTAAAVLLGANLALCAGAQGRTRGLGRVAGLALVLGVDRLFSASQAGHMRDFATAILSHRDPDPEAVVSTVLDAPVHQLPCIQTLMEAAPSLRRQGIAITAVPRGDRIPDYERSWQRLSSRFGDDVLVPPAFRDQSVVVCGRCFTALPTEMANRICTGTAHAACGCGRIVLPVDFRNEHVLGALAELAGASRENTA